MANIIDLNTIVKEDLEFKLLDGKIIKVPGELSTKFVLELTALQEKAQKANGFEDELNVLIDMTTLVLSQDKKANITREYVQENLNDLKIMQLIITSAVEHIENIANDKNL